MEALIDYTEKWSAVEREQGEEVKRETKNIMTNTKIFALPQKIPGGICPPSPAET